MKKFYRILAYSFIAICITLFAIWNYYYIPDIPVEILNEKYEVKPEEYIKVDGMNVHVKTAGPKSDTLPLVLLHGTNSSLYTWTGWTEELKDNHRIIRLDLPGFGLTGPHPSHDYRVETYLEFLESFMKESGIEKCVLAGNSLGGEIAWRYAMEHPDQVKKLILIGAAGYPVEIKELPLTQLPLSYLWLRIPLIREITTRFTKPSIIRNSLEYLYGDPERITDKIVEIYFDMTNREGNREALTERMEAFGEPAPYERIPSIQTPSLILWGGKDRLIPLENGVKFHENLPNSKLVVFPEAGHMPMEEIPDESVKAVKTFLNNSSLAKVEDSQ